MPTFEWMRDYRSPQLRLRQTPWRRRFFPHPNVRLWRLDQFPIRERLALEVYEQSWQHHSERELLRQCEREFWREMARDDPPPKPKPKRRTPRHRSGVVMPFGKYEGQPVEAVAADYKYCDWLLGETWFWERFGGLADVLRAQRRRRRRREYIDRHGRLVLPDGTLLVCPCGDGRTFWRFMKRGFRYGGMLVWLEPEVRDAA